MILLLFLLFLIQTNAFSLKGPFVKKYKDEVLKKSIIISEKKQSDVFILTFPGYDKEPKAYQELCSCIAKETKNKNVNVNFLIVDYLFNIPFQGEKQSEMITAFCLDYLKENDFVYNKLYFMGHSAGAYFCIPLVKDYGDGIIQLGSVFNSEGKLPWKSEKISTFDKPSLTLLGNKDGFTNHLLACNEMNDLKLNNQDILNVNKSIIIEKDVDHLHMCDGKLSQAAQIFSDKNIESPLLLSDAHEKISKTVSEFITLPYNESSYTNLYNKLIDSKNAIEEYNELKTTHEDFIKKTQYNVIRPNVFISIPITVEKFTSLDKFVLSKPSINENGSIEVKYALEPILKPITPYFSDTLAIKMKNQNAFLGNEKYKDTCVGMSKTARMVNQKLIKDELSKLNRKIQEIRIVFLPDKVCSSSIDWIKTQVSIEYNKDTSTLFLQSPVLYTKNNIGQRYSGMYYMKVLTPELAKELITLHF